MSRTMKISSPKEIVKIVQRGIAGQMTLAAASAQWGTLSELSLYPAIGLIFSARAWSAKCQSNILGRTYRPGAPRTIDFIGRPFDSKKWQLAIEVKLIATRSPRKDLEVGEDIKKLRAFKLMFPGSSAFLLIAGRKSDIDRASIVVDGEKVLLHKRPKVIADLGKAAWGSVTYEVN